MLRVAATREGPLALRLREGAQYFQEGPTYYRGSVKGIGAQNRFIKLEARFL